MLKDKMQIIKIKQTVQKSPSTLSMSPNVFTRITKMTNFDAKLVKFVEKREIRITVTRQPRSMTWSTDDSDYLFYISLLTLLTYTGYRYTSQKLTQILTHATNAFVDLEVLISVC